MQPPISSRPRAFLSSPRQPNFHRPRRNLRKILPHVTQQAIDDFRAVFDLYDTNHNNTIDAPEFADIISLLGTSRPSQKDLDQYIRQACDIEDDQEVPDSLNFRQFLNFFAVERAAGTEGVENVVEEAEIYKVLDKNGDGEIDRHELKAVLEGFEMKVGDAEVISMIKMMKDGGEKFGLAQFGRLVKRVRSFKKDGTISDSESSDTDSKDSL